MIEAKMTSFYSERTAEYSLIPNLMVALQTQFKHIAPIYYWRTREGNSLSRLQLKFHKVKILAMFARRVKIDKDKNFVYGKINDSILHFSHQAKNKGIPVIAGFIASTCLFENYNPNNHVWFDLNLPYNLDDIIFSCELKHPRNISVINGKNELSEIQIQKIPNIVVSQGLSFYWQDAIEQIYELNNSMNPDGHAKYVMWRAGYKPVYFIIAE